VGYCALGWTADGTCRAGTTENPEVSLSLVLLPSILFSRANCKRLDQGGYSYSLLCMPVTEMDKKVPKTRPLQARNSDPIVRLDRAAIREPIIFVDVSTCATMAELTSQH